MSSASAAAASTIRAVRVHENGDASKLQVDHIPALSGQSSLAPTAVCIAIEYSGINYIDTYHRSGLYKLPLPAVLGREGSGVVLQVGSQCQRVKVGDRVVFFGPGSYAEQVVIDESAVVALPAGISFRDAATAHLQGLTAHMLASGVYHVKENDYVLIHAAAGGTGNLLVQICKLKKAIVIATVGSAEKAALAKSSGADHVINYTETPDFVDQVKQLSGGKGVHVVYDGVGKATWERSLKSLRPRGYLVLFGNASGPVPPIDPLLLTSSGSVYLARPSLQYFTADLEEYLARSADLYSWIENGSVKLRVAKEFNLDEIQEAHKALESRQYAGKIVIKVKNN